MDREDYLEAVQIYLLAIHIHTGIFNYLYLRIQIKLIFFLGLELNTSQKVLEKFPILSRLKLAINLFRNRILDGIKRRLKHINLETQVSSYK